MAEYSNPHLKEKYAEYNAGTKTKIMNFLRRWKHYLRRDGVYRTIIRAYDRVKFGNGNCHSHQWWTLDHKLTLEELNKQRETKFDIEPLFSIVVPMYKTNEKYLGELISCVRTQTYKNLELCLADGTGEGSTLGAAVEKFAAGDKRIKYELLTKNGGIAENTNAAIRMATGDYIVFYRISNYVE